MKSLIEQITELSADNLALKEKLLEQELQIGSLQVETEYISCLLELNQK